MDNLQKCQYFNSTRRIMQLVIKSDVKIDACTNHTFSAKINNIVFLHINKKKKLNNKKVIDDYNLHK